MGGVLKQLETTPNDEVEPSAKVAIIAPDEPSGKAFYDEVAHATPATLFKTDLEARVTLEKGRFVKNPSKEIKKDLGTAVLDAYMHGHKKVVIACNTAQLWKDDAMDWLTEHGIKLPDVEVITTFDAVIEEFPNEEERPIWLGTHVVVDNMKPGTFKTLNDRNEWQLKDLTQEIIWRTKAATISFVPDEVKAFGYEKLDDKETLIEKTVDLVRKLKQSGIDKAILGCTELPIAFALAKERLEAEGLEFEGYDPANAIDKYFAKKEGDTH